MTDKNLSATEYAVALGFFDGLHKAHRRVLSEVLKKASSGFVPAVLLFDEHPRNVISGSGVPFLLQSDMRDEKLTEMGIERKFISFSEIKDMSPREFVEKILVCRLNARAVVCGYNYRFGKGAAGDTEELKRLCAEHEISVTIVEDVTYKGSDVSSTRIRKAVSEGEMEDVTELLGEPFTYRSEIFTGDRRGRLLGAPTVNQFIPSELIVPRFGVYASRVYAEGKEYIGVTNVGSRPTFDGESVRSETYILDFSGDLYGKTVTIELYKFIREEKKFPDGDSLKAQIALDVKSVQEYFGK